MNVNLTKDKYVNRSNILVLRLRISLNDYMGDGYSRRHKSLQFLKVIVFERIID